MRNYYITVSLNLDQVVIKILESYLTRTLQISLQVQPMGLASVLGNNQYFFILNLAGKLGRFLKQSSIKHQGWSISSFLSHQYIGFVTKLGSILALELSFQI